MIAIATGTYAYTAALNGAVSGQTTITVTHNRNGTYTIGEDGSGTVQGVVGTAQATLTLAPDFSPASYNAKLDVGGTDLTPSATFSGATVAISGGLQDSNATAPVGGHFVLIDGGLIAGFVALPAQVTSWPGTPLSVVAPVYGSSSALTVDPMAKPVRPADVPATDVAISFAAPVALVEWYDPITMIPDEIDVPSQGFTATRKR